MTFQLTDSVVVDPSSSYEESPSPSEDPDEEELNGTLADSAIKMPPISVPIEVPRSVTDGTLTSPKKDVSDGGFFSFDEELADDEDDVDKYQDVSQPSNPLWNFISLSHHRIRRLMLLGQTILQFWRKKNRLNHSPPLLLRFCQALYR